jgi:hypothetical protein
MGKGVRRKHAAWAVIEQALSKALAQLALAQSIARLCGDALIDDLDELVGRAIELRNNIANTEHSGAPANDSDGAQMRVASTVSSRSPARSRAGPY